MTPRRRYILMLVLCTVLESSLALAGVRLPLLPLCAIGVGIRHDALRLLPAELLAAAALDALWCHRLPAELLTVVAAAAIAAAIRRASAISWATQALAGALVAGAAALPATLSRGVSAASPLWGQLLAGLLLTPPLAAALERLLRQPVVWDERRGGVVVTD